MSSVPAASPPSALWLRPLGPVVVAVVAVLSFQQHPAPALDGGGLTVTAALVVLAASVLVFMRHADERTRGLLSALAMVLSSGALLWTQRGGPGVAGLFVAVAFAALRLSARRSLAVLGLAVLAVALAAVHADHTTGEAVASELGVVAFYVLSVFARRSQEAHEQTATLLAELEASRRSREEAAALRERGRIAREIHDVLAHSLSGLMLQLEGARMLAAAPSSNGQLSAALDRAHHLARAGLDEARRAISALRDEDDLPGPDRLEQLAADFSRDSRVAAELAVTGAPHALDSETSLTLYRVAQEALTNARKHARPQRVELRLAYERDGTRLVVEDHGVPPPDASPAAPAGYGLTGMRERAELLGGRLETGRTEDGFRVELWVPV